jgi:hypothetical protein
MESDLDGLDWSPMPAEPVPFDRLQPGVRYRIVIADC